MLSDLHFWRKYTWSKSWWLRRYWSSWMSAACCSVCQWWKHQEIMLRDLQSPSLDTPHYLICLITNTVQYLIYFLPFEIANLVHSKKKGTKTVPLGHFLCLQGWALNAGWYVCKDLRHPPVNSLIHIVKNKSVGLHQNPGILTKSTIVSTDPLNLKFHMRWCMKKIESCQSAVILVGQGHDSTIILTSTLIIYLMQIGQTRWIVCYFKEPYFQWCTSSKCNLFYVINLCNQFMIGHNLQEVHFNGKSEL